MKILEVCAYSEGICGVWERVKEESILLANAGHDVTIFSSNIVKGTDEIAVQKGNAGKAKIIRFPNRQTRLHKMISKNVTYFNFESEFDRLNPDLVITHLLHPHSFRALNLCKKRNIPCFLVTHAPFGTDRRFPLSMITKIYYTLNVKPRINKFKKIIAITHWERPYLNELNVQEEKIEYLPNGVPEIYFSQKIRQFKGKKVLFLGRVAPVKNIETLITAFQRINKDLSLLIVGPMEKGYEKIRVNQDKRIIFYGQVSNLKDKISILEESDIFVLPSKREGMPISLIEAMALGKIVVASKTLGAKDIIEHGKNGFLFEIGDSKGLQKVIEAILKMERTEINLIQKNAKKSVERYSWKHLFLDLKRIYDLK